MSSESRRGTDCSGDSRLRSRIPLATARVNAAALIDVSASHWNDLILRAFPRVGRGLRDISRKPGF